MKQLLIDALECHERWWARFPQDMTEGDKAVADKLRAAIDAPEQEPVAWKWEVLPNSEFQKRKGDKCGVYFENPSASGINIDCQQSKDNYAWTPLYVAPQPPTRQYPLPDSLYPGSKDWVQGDYAERVEWLHSMYENQKEQTKMYVQMSQPAADLTDDEIFRVIGKMPKSAYTLVDFARAVLAAHRGKE